MSGAPVDIDGIEERAGEDAGHPPGHCIYCGGSIPDTDPMPTCAGSNRPFPRMECVEPSAAEVCRHDRVVLLAEVKAHRLEAARSRDHGKAGPRVGLASGVMWQPFAPRSEDVRTADFRALARICRWSGHCKVWMSVAEHCVRVADLVRAWNKAAAPEYARFCLPDPTEEHRSVELQALVHDLHEVYGPGDQPGPMVMGDHPWAVMLREMEHGAAHAVRDALGVPRMLNPAVGLADCVMLATEAAQFMPDFPCGVCGGLGSYILPALRQWPGPWPKFSEGTTEPCPRCKGTGRHFGGLPKPLDERIVPWTEDEAWERWWARYVELGGVELKGSPTA